MAYRRAKKVFHFSKIFSRLPLLFSNVCIRVEASNTKKETTNMKVLETKNAPGAIGPYPQGFEVNGFV